MFTWWQGIPSTASPVKKIVFIFLQLPPSNSTATFKFTSKRSTGMRISKLLVAVVLVAACAFGQSNDILKVHPNKLLKFDSTDVYGYLDNPAPIYIPGGDDPAAEPIRLDRSFKDALCANLDKETIDRQSK
jgi:hypothetical protein